jgi:hypothetical protein
MCTLREWRASVSQAELDNAGNQGIAEMRVPCPDAYGDPLCMTKFYQMWRQKLPYVKVGIYLIEIAILLYSQYSCVYNKNGALCKVRTFHRFAICAECSDYNDEISKAKTVTQKLYWSNTKAQHLNNVSMWGRDTMILDILL